jgi:Domain of unknown function (DUF4189)
MTANWERVLRIAAATVVCLLTCGTQVTAQGYAAVAIGERGAWGASLGLSTANAANADAVRRCGGNCRVVMTGPGRCVAVAVSSRGGIWYGYAYGNDRQTVQRIAMKGCTDRAPGGSCAIKHVNCVEQRVDKVCRWVGTAPFCNGSCPGGWSLDGRASNATSARYTDPSVRAEFGKDCATGTKALCCRWQ